MNVVEDRDQAGSGATAAAFAAAVICAHRAKRRLFAVQRPERGRADGGRPFGGRPFGTRPNGVRAGRLEPPPPCLRSGRCSLVVPTRCFTRWTASAN
jgi:hypothetical protein